ncbi:hypothetical protein ACKKBG_A09070 [Auxenochlorella protothecoides x Auxenochlorella symbiontica]
MPVQKFKDGRMLDRTLGESILSLISDLPSAWWRWLLLPALPVAMIRVWKQGGVHPGDALEEWVHEQLAEHGAGTLAELREKCDLSGIRFEGGDQEEIQRSGRFLLQDYDSWRSPEGLVVTVATDVTCGIKAVLSWKRDKLMTGVPMTHSELYWPNADVVSPAKCVRASVSLPVFFRPMTVPSSKDERVPFAGVCADDLLFTKWTETGFTSTIPDRVRFQDGGVISNFPINLFHLPSHLDVRWPTFGVGLSPPKEAQSTSGLGQLLVASVTTATAIQDVEFNTQNKECALLTQTVNTGKVCALDFNMSILGKFVLFYNGVLAARDFLMGTKERDGFHWDTYKMVRHDLAEIGKKHRLKDPWTTPLGSVAKVLDEAENPTSDDYAGFVALVKRLSEAQDLNLAQHDSTSSPTLL